MYLLSLDKDGIPRLSKHDDDNIPAYAILSHTWLEDQDEPTYQDIEAEQGQSKLGYKKILFCGKQAKADGLEYFWIDSCCINRVHGSELSEAIVSMFRWYQNASVCYAYLQGVTSPSTEGKESSDRPAWEATFKESRWFTRGWTLQELLAPKSVKFYGEDESLLGTKESLEDQISTITGIPPAALQGAPLSDFSVKEKMSWQKGRQTKRKEDRAYCLHGLFEVYLAPLYGEGEYAWERLLNEIDRSMARLARENSVGLHDSRAEADSPPSGQMRALTLATGSYEPVRTRAADVQRHSDERYAAARAEQEQRHRKTAQKELTAWEEYVKVDTRRRKDEERELEHMQALRDREHAESLARREHDFRRRLDADLVLRKESYREKVMRGTEEMAIIDARQEARRAQQSRDWDADMQKRYSHRLDTESGAGAAAFAPRQGSYLIASSGPRASQSSQPSRVYSTASSAPRTTRSGGPRRRPDLMMAHPGQYEAELGAAQRAYGFRTATRAGRDSEEDDDDDDE